MGKQLLPETIPEMVDKLEVTPGKWPGRAQPKWELEVTHCGISQERTQVEEHRMVKPDSHFRPSVLSLGYDMDKHSPPVYGLATPTAVAESIPTHTQHQVSIRKAAQVLLEGTDANHALIPVGAKLEVSTVRKTPRPCSLRWLKGTLVSWQARRWLVA